VNNLHLYATFFEEDKLIPHSAYTTSPVLIVAANPDALKNVEKQHFYFSAQDTQVIIGSKKYSLDEYVDTDFGKVKFIHNKNFRGNAEKPLYFTIQNPKIVSASLLSKLRAVSPSKQSTVVSLSIRDADPLRGEDILNELIKVYNLASIEDKRRLASNTFAFVEDRLKEMEKKSSDH
jgi:hypothetical protein